MKISHTKLRLTLAAGLVLGAMPTAFAAGTAAGTPVANTASVAYKVGTVDQTPETSNTTTFLVDRKINLTVAEASTSATSVVPGDTAKLLTYTVTNLSNSTLDFRLVATEQVGGAAPFVNGAQTDDTIDVEPGFIVRVENGLAGGYQSSGPNQDTLDYIDELAPDTGRTVYIIADIGLGAVNTDIAAIALTAIAAGDFTTETDGDYTASPADLEADAVETNAAVVDDAAFIDTVFADGAGDLDAAEDGQHSDTDQYNVVTASIAVTKSSTVVTDPFNCTIAGDNSSCTTPPKAIPGAIVEYCLDVNNTGSAAAGSIVLTDALQAETPFLASSIKSAVPGTGSACTLGAGTSEDDDAIGADDGPAQDGGNISGANVTISTPSIAGGSRWRAAFRVTID